MSLDLELDAEQQAIAESLAQLCADRCDDAALAAAAEAFPWDLWHALAELGVLAIGTPEGEGGPLEMVAALEALGRGAFPGPLVATFTAAALLPERERVRVTRGEAIVSLGAPPLLPFAPVAGVFVALDGERAWLGRPEGEVEPLETLAGEPWGRVELVPVAELPAAEAALALGDTARAACLAASGARLVDVAAEHARTRRQFGRAIGEFQAVAHPLADAAIALAAARDLARRAAWRLAEDVAGAPEAAAAARRSAERAALTAAHVAHQTFGAQGVTLEGPVFHVSRRIRQLASQPPDAARGRALLLAAYEGRKEDAHA